MPFVVKRENPDTGQPEYAKREVPWVTRGFTSDLQKACVFLRRAEAERCVAESTGNPRIVITQIIEKD